MSSRGGASLYRHDYNTGPMIGHVGGAPIEELLLPFLATSAPMLMVAAKITFSRAAKRGKPRHRKETSQ